MFRGFRSYRAFLNNSLHALSAVICGDDEVIDAELARRGLNSVKDLDLKEAKQIYGTLLKAAKKASSSHNKLKQLVGEGRITERQRAAIIKITKYVFKWSDEAAFSYIADMYPDHRKRLSLWEISKSKIYKLLHLLSQQEADKLIKRLTQIEKRNKVETDIS